MKKVLICLFALSVVIAGSRAMAYPSIKDVDVKAYFEAGLFVPNEGDLDLGPLGGLGIEYTVRDDTFFADLLYASTDLDVALNIDRADNLLIQLGYLTNFNTWDRGKVGLGFQIHRMEMGDMDYDTSRIGLMLLGEYDFSARWSVRIQDSVSLKDDGIRHGGLGAMIRYNFN